jgi:hypothetical protein
MGSNVISLTPTQQEIAVGIGSLVGITALGVFGIVSGHGPIQVTGLITEDNSIWYKTISSLAKNLL